MSNAACVFFVHLTSSVAYTHACISTAGATATIIGPVCSKCATIKKSDKLSCCAPGGAWFNNCGTSDNPNFDHTWIEGMKACKDAASLIVDKKNTQSMLPNQTSAVVSRHQPTGSPAPSTHGARMSNSVDRVSPIISFTNLLLIILHTQIYIVYVLFIRHVWE